ncbi:MAG: hypothetical protein Fur005_39700 [Roseiflexaceae bacterium]
MVNGNELLRPRVIPRERATEESLLIYERFLAALGMTEAWRCARMRPRVIPRERATEESLLIYERFLAALGMTEAWRCARNDGSVALRSE